MSVKAPEIGLQVGDPVTHRGVSVTPLFPATDPVAAYVTLDEGHAAGLRVSEVGEAGSVPQLTVHNPGPDRVLMYDGEELQGAKQNRILDLTVLVEAASELVIPVSCVEQGRWSRRSAHLAPAPHAAHPELRRVKADRLAETDAAPGAGQGRVWAEVAAKAARLGSHSDTSAHADTYRSRAGELAELAERFPLHAGQCGMVLAFDDRPVCLDVVSRPDAFRVLHPKLLAGYMLDAIEHLDGRTTERMRIEGFVTSACVSTPSLRPGVGLGQNLTIANVSVTGSGLVLDDEVLQLSAFARSGGLFGSRITPPGSRRP